MRKYLFVSALLLGAGLLFMTHQAKAETQEVTSFDEAKQVEQSRPLVNPMTANPLNDIATEEEFRDYIKKRLKSVLVTKYDEESADYGNSATSAVEDITPEEIEASKSTFQKIYENAIRRIEAEDRQQNAEPVVFTQPINTPEQPELSQQSLDTIDILLPPLDTRVKVPAFEHIPYLFTQLEVLPDGLLKVQETIMVIANGKKLKSPLVKSVPDSVVSNTGEKRPVDINLVSVVVNGQPVEYRIEKRGGSTLFMPKENFALENGVYKYVFTYLVDRQVWSYPDYNELYWDVSGSAWNLVITRAGASVILPAGKEPLSQMILTGYPYSLQSNTAVITRDAPNVIGFAATTPLFLAEGMHLVVDMPKDTIAAPDFSKKFSWFITDHGEFTFALIGLLVILGAYLASWKYIQKNPKKSTINLKKTPMMLRFLLKGSFDKTGFGAFLLDLFKKNIIDIQKNDDSILLVKRTDDLKALNNNEQKAMLEIFGKKDAVFYINQTNLLKLKRAAKYIARDVSQKFNLFGLKINAGYLGFSLGMLFLVEFFVAQLHIDSMAVFTTLFLATVSFGLYLFLFSIRWKNKLVNLLVKIFSALFMLLCYIIMCAKISLWTALLLVASLIVIAYFTKLYTRRSGLLRGNIIEAQNYADYLAQNQENISLGRDFLNQQANIFALDVSHCYHNNPSLKDYYKLDIMQEAISKL